MINYHLPKRSWIKIDKKKLSPFTQVIYYITGKLDEEDIDIKLINSLPVNYILQMCVDIDELVVYLDEYFNNYGLTKLDTFDLVKFLRKVFSQIPNSKYRNWYFPNKPSKNDVLKNFHERYPWLKKDEIELLYDHLLSKEEKEMIDETFNPTYKGKIKK